MGMSRKDYVLLAEAFGSQLGMHTRYGNKEKAAATWECVVLLSDCLKQLNPNFDRDRFTAAAIKAAE